MKTFEKERLFNPQLPHEMRLPARSTVIPSLSEDVYYQNKEESSLLTILNGNFKFCYQKKDVVDNFYETDFDDSGWDILSVPSMWQYHGYSLPVYPNIDYSIPFDPPYVGNYNPVGYYRKKFTVKKTGRHILYFGGVDSAFFVYLNGEYIGFSKGSRIPAEFDVTNQINDGENLLAIKVFTYSDGTYLENQDMLLSSGIFRDVFIYNLAEVSVWDYKIKTVKNKVYIDVSLSGKISDGYSLLLGIDDMVKELSAKTLNSCVFELDSPIYWNAELPFTYKLTIKLIKDGKTTEIHSKKFGLAEYEVKGNKLLLNGTQITLKGINRHEHDPKNGRAITVDRIENELRLIKEHNLNAIRCAHYPNHPAFYEFATEMGLYVMNEADIETHGSHTSGDMGCLAKLPEWYNSYIDRVERMYERDKNETCISIWTVGNEHGSGENLYKCIEYLRTRDIKKPIMNTNASYTDPDKGDFRGEGYFTMESLTSHKEEGLPVMLLEYGHAMGNSPGLMEDTWDYVYKNRHIAGGYLWELKNHGFYKEDEDGNASYLYGGDFGDINHWSNFSMDGYCLSDGTPKPSLRDSKNVLSPTYVTYENGKIILTNTNDFRPLDYITLKWELLEDYKIIRCGSYKLPAIMPYESEILDIKTDIENPISGAKYYLNLKFYGENGEEISFKQIFLGIKKEKEKFKPKSFNPLIKEENEIITISDNDFSVSFENGLLIKFEKSGNTIINSPMKLNIYRAPIDNDGIEGLFERWIKKWDDHLLKYFDFHCHETSVLSSETSVTITANGIWAPISKYIGFSTEIIYKIMKGGNILITIHALPYGVFPEVLPRLGVVFEMDKEYQNITWYGRGEDENYPDRKAHTNFGLYKKVVSDLNFIYDIPQECGTRIDNSYLLINSQNNGLSVIGSDTFVFSYHDFTLDDLTTARHRNELKKSDSNYLYIDYRMRGLGSHSCGPNPEECYELRAHEFKFSFMLSAETDEQTLLSLSRVDFGEKTEALSGTHVYEKKASKVNVIECNINND